MSTYTKTIWVDDQAPAIDAINLNKIEDGIFNTTEDINSIISGTTTVGRALLSDSATTLIGGIPVGVPIGTMLMFPSVILPTDYLECNGATLPRTHALFSVLGTTYGAGDGTTTFNLPDMRGVFPRGWDHGRGKDLNRALGSYQDDSIQEHTHTVIRNLAPLLNGFGAVIGGAQNAQSSGVNDARVSTETRPVNVSVIYIIKAA